MNCEQLRKLLDAYMDGELSDGELREMEAHAAACADCRREFEAAKLVREALGSLPEEVAVPLDAQARWRRAVREEAEHNVKADERTVDFVREKRKSSHRWMRAAYAVAAALVLVLGATALLGRMPGREAAEPMTVAVPDRAIVLEEGAREAGAMPTGAVVARDGMADASGVFPIEGETYAAWKKFRTEDGDAQRAACETVEALAEEYSGSCELLPGGDTAVAGGASYYRVELPSEYLGDFLSAIGHVGEELDSETREPEGDAAIVYIQIEEMEAD